MDRLIYVRPETVAEVTKGQFLPTVLLTEAAAKAVLDGKLELRKGQWVIDGRTGERGQFVRITKGIKKSIRLRKAKEGMTFAQYQTKLAA